MEQLRPSDGGGDVGRPWPERASFRSRAGTRSLGARQTRVLAMDISLPRHHDYRPAEVVRLGGYKWLARGQVCQHHVGALLATVPGTAIPRPLDRLYVHLHASPTDLCWPVGS